MDAVVIGGGHAGLATSQQLAQRDIEHVVLERGRIGETWRSQRWDTFTLNTPSWMNKMPGDGESDLAEPLDTFPFEDLVFEDPTGTGSLCFGSSLAGPGDVNGDGYVDLIVGGAGCGTAWLVY